MNVLNRISNYRLILIFILSIPVAAQAEDILYGKDIKNQASKFFSEIGITGEILTSDRRAFFSCKEELNSVHMCKMIGELSAPNVIALIGNQF